MFKFLKSLLILIALLFSFSIQAQVWKKLAKSGNAGLLDIVFISKSNGFVLSSGKVLKTTDTGKTWTQILSSYNRFTHINFIDANNGFIIGYDDLVLKTTDGGTNWSLRRTGNSDDDLLNIFAIDQDTVFVTGPDNLDNKDSINYLEYTYNGGNSWSRKSLNSSKILTSLKMWTKNKGVLCTLSNGVFVTTNGFSNYNVNTSLNIQISDFKVIQDSIVVLVGNNGKIVRSIDYGKTYKSVSSPTSENLKGIYFTNDSVGMVCGEKGTILMSYNSGLSWTLMATHTKLNFTKVIVINPYLAWAVAYSTSGDSLDIFKYEDKSCLSRFIRVPQDTVVCDKFVYETPFKVEGLNKPNWKVDDNLTKFYRKNDTTASIVGSHEGRYEITFELQNCEEILRDTFIVFIWRNPTIYVKDSLYCGSVKDNISFSCFACQYLWSDYNDSYHLVATQPGKYWVRVTNRCKSMSDTFTLSYLPYLKLDLGHDTILCNNEKLILKNTLSPGKYLWNNLDTIATKTILKAGNYSLNFKNKCNNLSDTINVSYKKTPSLYLGKDSIYCKSISHSISLDSVKNISTVSWWDGDNQFNKKWMTPGKYYASIRNECGIASDTIQLGILNIPQVYLGRDTIYCNNFKHSVTINPNVKDFNVVWWDSKDSIIRNFSNSGEYSVKVFNRCGEVRDTLKIVKIAKPVVDLGRDTMLGKPFVITLDAKNDGCNYQWTTGSTAKTITVNEYGGYRVIVSNYCGSDDDTINIAKPLSINNISKINLIKVYPNPVINGIVIIENFEGNIELELFDQLGNMLLNNKVSYHKLLIDMSQFSQGVYYLKISNNGIMTENIRLQKL